MAFADEALSPARTRTDLQVDDVSGPPLLPPEMWWHIVDLLLPTLRGVEDAARLGLACRDLALSILEDEGAWAFRCRRDFGSERVALRIEQEHFDLRWLCLYAAMAIRLDTNAPASTRSGQLLYGSLCSRKYQCSSFVGGQIAWIHL